MASSRPWRWLVLLTSGGLFGFAVLAAQASGGDAVVDPVEAIETPLPSRTAPVIPDADPSDIVAPGPAIEEDGQPESFHARGHTRAKRANRSNRTNRSKPGDFRVDHRFAASKSGIFPSQIFESEDDNEHDNEDDAPVAQQANPAPR